MVTQSAPGVNGENVDPVAQLARETVEAQYDAENGVGLEGIASTEGKAILDVEAVDVVDIADAGGGKVSLQLRDGRTADAAELSFPDSGEAELWRVIGKYAENADSARALLEEYRNGNVDAFTYARGIEEAFLYGKVNLSPREMELQGTFVNRLSPTQRNMAYQQGNIAGKRKTQRQQDKVASDKKKSTKNGALHFEGDRGKLTARQKVSLQTCEIVAKALGIQVYVFESERVNGKRVGDNGWYDPKDGSIHIDLHAGENGEEVMVFTLAHELTHFIRDWSPAKFRTLSGFLSEQYAKKGHSVADLVRAQQKKAEDDGRKLSFEKAHEEWVADSMEQMLTDGTLVEKLAMLQAKDKGLVEKIKSFLDGFLKRLKAAYQGVSPRTQEGQIVGEMVDAAQELQDLFADALLDAGENFRSAEKNTTGDGGVRYSIRRDIVDVNGKEYDSVVELDKSVSARTLSDPRRLMKYIEHNLAGVQIPVIDASGGTEIIEFAKPNEVTYKNGKRHPVLGELKYTKGDTRKQVIINAVEVVGESVYDPQYSSTDNEHGWLDTNGWESRKCFVLAKDGNVYEAYLKIAKAKDGRNILYTVNLDINKGIAVDQGATQKRAAVKSAMPSGKNIPQSSPVVKENDSTEKRTSSRSGAVSDRAMLVDLFEQMVTDSTEYDALQKYKRNMDHMLALEEQVDRLTEEIKRVSFAEGPRNMEYLDNLKAQRKKAVAELNRYDNILLGLEKSGVLRSMIERNRQVIRQESYKKAREYYREKNEKREAEIRQYYRESRRKAVEQIVNSEQ